MSWFSDRLGWTGWKMSTELISIHFHFHITNDVMLETNLLKNIHWPWTFKAVFLSKQNKGAARLVWTSCELLPPTCCLWARLFRVRSFISWHKYILWSTKRVFSTLVLYKKNWAVKILTRQEGPSIAERAELFWLGGAAVAALLQLGDREADGLQELGTGNGSRTTLAQEKTQKFH